VGAYALRKVKFGGAVERRESVLLGRSASVPDSTSFFQDDLKTARACEYLLGLGFTGGFFPDTHSRTHAANDGYSNPRRG
jgi:hypothetical protein